MQNMNSVPNQLDIIEKTTLKKLLKSKLILMNRSIAASKYNT